MFLSARIPWCQPHLGRETLHQLDLAASPRYVSKHNHSLNKSDSDELLFSQNKVNEIIKLLEVVSIVDGKLTEEETKEETNDDESNYLTLKRASVLLGNDAEKAAVGCFDDTVFSKKANGDVEVKRSARFADNHKNGKIM